MRRMLIALVLVAGGGLYSPGAAAPRVHASPFVTTGFTVMRKGPGASWPLLSVIPPSARVQVNQCSTYWTPGWCEVSYGGLTGSVRSSRLRIASAQKAGAGGFARGPHFLIAAETQYGRAAASLKAADQKLARLRRLEARQSQKALAATGSWIEPGALWRETVSAQQQSASAREREQRARAQLDDAEERASAASSAQGRGGQPASWASWWRW
jgi:hypothetical protein